MKLLVFINLFHTQKPTRETNKSKVHLCNISGDAKNRWQSTWFKGQRCIIRYPHGLVCYFEPCNKNDQSSQHARFEKIVLDFTDGRKSDYFS